MKIKTLMLLLIIAAITISGCIENDEADATTISDDSQNIDKIDDDNNLDLPGNDIEAISDICVECHQKPVNTIKESGGLHSQKSCNFCHPQHGQIPTCSDCHELYHGDAITNCEQCHTDAHAPRDLTFSMEESEYSCSMCHTNEANTLEANPTKHTDMNCINCHIEHGSIPACVNCHMPHDDTMTADDCSKCHETGHIPTKIKT